MNLLNKKPYKPYISDIKNGEVGDDYCKKTQEYYSPLVLKVNIGMEDFKSKEKKVEVAESKQEIEQNESEYYDEDYTIDQAEEVKEESMM